MMIPGDYVLSEYENADYFELLELKDDLVKSISSFEQDYDMKIFDWKMDPLPDAQYQWNLFMLGKVSQMLKDAFNREYVYGEKSISDFYNDMKKYKGEQID